MHAMKSLSLACALSLASAGLVAAERPSASAGAQRDDMQPGSVVESVSAKSSKIGPWHRRSDAAIVIPAEQAPIGRSEIPLMLTTDGVTPGSDRQRRVALRINDGLDHLGAELVPGLADYAGIEHLEIIPYETFTGTFLGCNWKLTVRDVYIQAPFGSSSVTGDFRSGNKVLSDFNLPTANAHAELGFDPGGSFLCLGGGEIWATFDVGDLDGNVDVTLSEVDGATQVSAIDDIEMSVDEFSWDTSSPIVDALLWLGSALYVAIDPDCSSIPGCLTEVVNQYGLENDDYLDEMVGFVNGLLATPLSIRTGGSTDGLHANFSMDLHSLKSSTGDNTLTTLWNTVVTSSAPVDPCAAALTAMYNLRAGSVGDAQLTGDDMELEIPFNILTEIAYYAGKQGLFCQDATFTYGLSLYPVNVVPNGAVKVSKGTGSDPDNLIKFTLPLKATAAVGTGSISGTLIIKGTLAVDGGSDLVFTTTSADVSNLSGSVSVTPLLTFTAAQLEPTIDAAASRIVTEMNDIELLNAVADLGSIGVGVAAHDVTTDGGALVIGLNIQ